MNIINKINLKEIKKEVVDNIPENCDCVIKSQLIIKVIQAMGKILSENNENNEEEN